MSIDIEQSSVVLYDARGGVATITLNRPGRRNAWTPEMERAYFGLLERAAADDAVRAILVTGAAGDFCPGTDAELLAEVSNGSRVLAPEERSPQTLPMTIPKPVIVAIEGACAGTGLIQACVADVRFIAADAKVTAAFARRGIMAEHGLAVLLPALVGTAHAMDMLLSGRVLTGTEAAGIGLARLSRPGEALADARAYALDVAAHCAPQAVAFTKLQVYRDLAEPLESARVHALRLWRTLREHADFKEGIASFVERRPPRFAGVGRTGLDDIRRTWDLSEGTHD